MGVSVRRIEPGDADEVAALVTRAHERGDLGAASPWLEHGFKPSMVPAGMAAVAVDDDELVGVVLPDLKAIVVEPDRRLEGIGKRLVVAGCEIVRAAGGEALFLGTWPGERGAEDFLEATGFAYHSSVWDLALEATVPVADPALPDGYHARPFRRAADLETWVAAFNEAFTGHPTPLSLDATSYAQWIQDADIPPHHRSRGAAAAARRGGGAAPAPRPRAAGAGGAKAEIWALGVRPGLQGRGLGRTALRLGIARLRAIGASTVTLSVSGHNPRAVSLYEAEGFERTSTRDRWARPVDGPQRHDET